MKRWLFLLHRWLGLGGCLLIFFWFASGVVMMYMPFPHLSHDERLAALPVIDEDALSTPPTQAVAVARDERTEQLRLLQPAERPVYALRTAQRGWIGIDARNGNVVQIDEEAARRAAERFAQQPAVAVEWLERDQWSVSTSLDPHRPLFAVHMADGGLHYVSSRTGEVVRDTQRWERGWNWVGAVVHWVYPTALRSRPQAWHWTVIALSGYALLTALLGTVIGIMRFKRYASGKRSPYTGWMRWHHLLGLSSVVFVTTWLFSGLMSMNPGNVFSPHHPSAQLLHAWGGRLTNPALPILAGRDVKELEWFPDGAQALVLLRLTSTSSLMAGTEEAPPVNASFLRPRLAALGFGAPQQIERLDALDLHYHARNAARPFPIWRARFSDAKQTWVHIDGQSGQPFGLIDASNRTARWLYHGLHSWDFEFLLQRRPLWDGLMLSALALGTTFSATCVAIAWRRLRSHVRQHACATPRVAPPAPSNPHSTRSFP